MSRRWPIGLLLVVLATLPASGQTVSGRLFEDRDADGIADPGEPGIAGISVRLFGRTAQGGAVDLAMLSDSDGGFAFAPGDGIYLLAPDEPADWRLTEARIDGVAPGDPRFVQPVGQPRFSFVPQTIAALEGGTYRYTAIGDSIAWNFNFCGYPESFWYSKRLRDRLNAVAPAASVTLDEGAVKGEHTDDLLVPDGGEMNNVFSVVAAQPELVTLSMIGNDLLDVDPGSGATAQQTSRAVAEVLDARQNLQEVLSTLVTQVPQADIALNTLYDNETYNCYSGNAGDFHRTWIPIVNRILRDLAWGQARRLSINEVAAEFAREDLVGDCTGFAGLICRDFFGFDEIHPTNLGFSVLLEKVWEGIGGVALGEQDTAGRSSLTDVDFGYLRRTRRLLPTVHEARDGAVVIQPDAALDDADGELPAQITLGAGAEEFRLSGFPDWFDEVQIVRAVTGVRYRTNGPVGDDGYRMEASVTDRFRPDPGFDYAPTAWNFFTPIVGGGGPSQPDENPDYPGAVQLAAPDVSVYREVTATLSKNPTLGPTTYEWPAVTHQDLATATVRVASAPLAGTPGNDGYTLELDYAWIDLYGWEKPRPEQVSGLRLARQADGALELTFDALPDADRYNVYFGRVATQRAGAYDHGAGAPAGPFCAAPANDAGSGRLQIVVAAGNVPPEASYVVVTAHVDDVESPTGRRSDATEYDRSRSTCR